MVRWCKVLIHPSCMPTPNFCLDWQSRVQGDSTILSLSCVTTPRSCAKACEQLAGLVIHQFPQSTCLSSLLTNGLLLPLACLANHQWQLQASALPSLYPCSWCRILQGPSCLFTSLPNQQYHLKANKLSPGCMPAAGAEPCKDHHVYQGLAGQCLLRDGQSYLGPLGSFYPACRHLLQGKGFCLFVWPPIFQCRSCLCHGQGLMTLLLP